MIRIIDGRGTGKTSKLMLLAKENNAVFVCSNPRAMKYKAEQYGISDVEFQSYYDFLDDHNSINNYIIDEVDTFLKSINNNIICFSLTNE